MAEQNATVDAAGCLGRILTAIGAVWAVIAILASVGILNRVGLGSGFVATAAASLFPAILLLAAGRALRRRSRAARVDLPAPKGPGAKRVPSSRQTPAQQAPIPAPVPTPPPPKPAAAAPRPQAVAPSGGLEPTSTTAPTPSEVPTDPGPAAPIGRPKTSEELIEEARKRWGTGR